uniref:RING-type domain-containing protein n=1 Tax=Hanusia phi TaxID=3032 RepID=A0A7S0H9B8_9CRYP
MVKVLLPMPLDVYVLPGRGFAEAAAESSLPLSPVYIPRHFETLQRIQCPVTPSEMAERLRAARQEILGQLMITSACQAGVSLMRESCQREEGGEDESQVKICEICQADYEPNESVTCLPCNHLFHSCCINRWIDTRLNALQLFSCPLCRRSIPCSLEQEDEDSHGIQWHHETRWLMVTNWVPMQVAR